MSDRWLNLQLFAAEEKTEEPTPHRREEVRKQGQAARSADLNAAVVLLAGMLMLWSGHRVFLERLARLGYATWGHGATELTVPEVIGLFRSGLAWVGQSLAPLVAVALTAGLVISFAQVGWTVSFAPLRPRLENVNPARGFQRMFSRRALMELAKALLKVVLTALVVYLLVRDQVRNLLLLAYSTSGWQVYATVSELLLRLGLLVGGIYGAVAVWDYAFQRRQFLQQLRMTRFELKEELRQTEGDPQVRARLRQRQRQLARQRMMRQVPQATVVITNPTHLAVALRYDQKVMKAPVVVAKGVNWLAERIVKVARESRVPVVQNPPLAQALYRTVEVGREIPPELYHAVAEILALLYRTYGRLGGAVEG
ncbi:MAG: flagellar biosynthesis protein FlhB [Moorellales bacterium]